MPPHLIIDGYNYIMRTALAGADVETARDLLLEQLVEYRKQKASRITVVFDAMGGVHLARSRTNYRGIELIYSGRDETADDVIKEIIRARMSGTVVVSSDRELIDEAKKRGIVFMVPARLEAALSGEIEGPSERPSERRGQGRKLPKKIRKARRTLGKV